jgi:hypothetical protein
MTTVTRGRRHPTPAARIADQLAVVRTSPHNQPPARERYGKADLIDRLI